MLGDFRVHYSDFFFHCIGGDVHSNSPLGNVMLLFLNLSPRLQQVYLDQVNQSVRAINVPADCTGSR